MKASSIEGLRANRRQEFVGTALGRELGGRARGTWRQTPFRRLLRYEGRVNRRCFAANDASRTFRALEERVIRDRVRHLAGSLRTTARGVADMR